MLLDDLLSQTRLVTVPYGDSELNIEYYRQRLTDAEGQRIVNALQGVSKFDDQSLALICELLSRVIAWWDLYATEGVPLPVNMDSLRQLPFSILSDLVITIFNNETKPNPPTITVNVDA